MYNSFETLLVDQQFINTSIVSLFKFIIYATILSLIIKIFFFKKIRLMGIVKNFIICFKVTTCLIAIFFVFFYNFETHKIGFNNGPMLYSTFLIGALATWDILSLVIDHFKSIEDLFF